MLTEQEKQEISEELKHCERPEAAAIEALRVVQKKRGWVSDASLRDVAAQLSMTPAELDAVATFYSFIFRKPVGRHVIALCDSMVCWSLGHDDLYKLISTKLGIGYGETTGDNRFTLLPASCLGACDRAPAMMVDDELFGPVTPETIDEILSKYS
ncbi:MAG: NADH-quinone oxidoreductase subunit NuoE [Nitrospirota bacterium]|nr:NADH-quinone oxidoreductase subunit NuoE [Nitrospirota bacterium]